MSGDSSGGATWTKSTIRLSHHVILVPHLGSVSSQTNCNLIAKVTNALAAPISLHWLKFYSALFLLLHNLRNLLNLFTISRHTCRFPQQWENSPCPNPIESSHNKSNIHVQYSILVYQTSPSSSFSGWSLSSFCNNHITLLELDLDPQSIIIQNSVKIHQQNHWYVKGQGHLIVISKFIGNYLPFCYRIKHSCSVVCWIGPRADVGGDR